MLENQLELIGKLANISLVASSQSNKKTHLIYRIYRKFHLYKLTIFR